MDTMTTTTNTLSADLLTDGWTVVDAHGGRWFPAPDALVEIEAADDPAATAVEICEREPMRGTWHD